MIYKTQVAISEVSQLREIFSQKDVFFGMGLDSNTNITLCVLNGKHLDFFVFQASLLLGFDSKLVNNQSRLAVYDLKTFFKKLNEKLGFGFYLEKYLEISIVCVMLGGYIQNSNLDFELERQAKRLLSSEVLSELEELDVKNLGLGLKNSGTVALLAQFYVKNFDEKTTYLWEKIESPLSILLAKMELNGVYIDRAKLQIVSDELQISIDELRLEIINILNAPTLNLNSPSQLGTVLLERGFKLKTGSKGKISTDREVLESLETVDNLGVISKILEYRTVTKLFSTYTDSFLKLLDGNSRIHGSYSQTQASTGRLSSNNPNLQNIPIRNPKYGPLIRSTFSAPLGRVIVGADYSQMELRLLAHFCQDPVLMDAFKENQDIHVRTSAEIFEIPLSEVTKEQRRTGKTLNFALIYQQGPMATAKQLGVSTKQAKEYIEKYFARFAHVKPFVDSVLNNARQTGYVETLFGRKRFFDNLNSENDFLRKIDERAAFNAVLQGSNADIIKVAMLNLVRRFEKEEIDAQIVLQVHDELVLEVVENKSGFVKQILIQEMELGQPLKVPILVDAGIGKNWSEVK